MPRRNAARSGSAKLDGNSNGGLNASFTVAEWPAGYRPIDHGWMFDDPELFVAHLAKFGLSALAPA